MKTHRFTVEPHPAGFAIRDTGSDMAPALVSAIYAYALRVAFILNNAPPADIPSLLDASPAVNPSATLWGGNKVPLVPVQPKLPPSPVRMPEPVVEIPF